MATPNGSSARASGASFIRSTGCTAAGRVAPDVPAAARPFQCELSASFRHESRAHVSPRSARMLSNAPRGGRPCSTPRCSTVHRPHAPGGTWYNDSSRRMRGTWPRTALRPSHHAKSTLLRARAYRSHRLCEITPAKEEPNALPVSYRCSQKRYEAKKKITVGGSRDENMHRNGAGKGIVVGSRQRVIVPRFTFCTESASAQRAQSGARAGRTSDSPATGAASARTPPAPRRSACAPPRSAGGRRSGAG